jgi:rhodanese-related sulfurtransferase
MGEAGALQVNSQLQTSDPAIYAAGDMVEITHAVLNTPVRIPLAGPANRQGRIVAENALGGSREYKGSLGTSIVKFFGAVVASTGLTYKRAKELGLAVSAVVTHKLSHTAYYPGAERVTLLLVFDPETGVILGAQAAGRDGVDKRIDVISTAIAGGLTIEDLQEIDLAYAPPFNSPNGPVHMTAFTAQNHRAGFSPSVLAADLEEFVLAREPIAVDLRDPISYRASYLHGSTNLSQNQLREAMSQIPQDQAVVIISEDGQKGHVATRMLLDAGVQHVFNLSGGAISMERYARAIGYSRLQVKLLPVEPKHPQDIGTVEEETPTAVHGAINGDGPLIIDVRTFEEFEMGAVPGAIHVALDELMERIVELGDVNREITLYCASGARSAYGQRLLQQAGFVNVRNGGGLHDMLAYQ